MTVLTRCLKAAEAVARDPSVVRKAGFPSRPEFDAALEELADYMWRDGERYYKAYGRAFESPEGKLLYTARELAATPEQVWKQQPPDVLRKSEQAIDAAVTAYCADHPQCSREKALIAVLETRPSLYQDYERECSEQEKGSV